MKPNGEHGKTYEKTSKSIGKAWERYRKALQTRKTLDQHDNRTFRENTLKTTIDMSGS